MIHQWSLRTSLAAAAIVAGTAVVAGHAQPGPACASSSVPSRSDQGVGAFAPGPPITPAWAQLNLATNLLASANHQLNLFLIGGSPIIPPNRTFPADQNALDFYLLANAVLDAVAVPGPPIAPPAQWNAALNAILGETDTTLLLLHGALRPSLLYGQIFTQRDHTIAVATQLLVFDDIEGRSR